MTVNSDPSLHRRGWCFRLQQCFINCPRPHGLGTVEPCLQEDNNDMVLWLWLRLPRSCLSCRAKIAKQVLQTQVRNIKPAHAHWHSGWPACTSPRGGSSACRSFPPQGKCEMPLTNGLSIGSAGLIRYCSGGREGASHSKENLGQARQAQSPATLLPFDLIAPYTERHVSCRLRMCEAKFSLRPLLVRRHIRKHIVFMLTKFNFQMKKGERGQVHETNSTDKRCQPHVTPRKLHASGLAA